MTRDPLSDILKLVDAHPVVAGGFSAGGAWAIRFPQPDKIKFFALVRGGCWLCIDEETEPVRVEEGDVFLLSGQNGFVLASEPGITPVDAVGLFTGEAIKTATLGDGKDCVQIGGHVRLDPANSELLVQALPHLIHIRADSAQAPVLKWLLNRLVCELSTDLPGTALAASSLAQLMFIEILRVHLDTVGESVSGMFRVIGDRRLAPALRLMHADPGHPWRLKDLAAASAMSRTGFAVHFKAIAEMSPLEWLTRWRMSLAKRALQEEETSVAELAKSLGYASESAFSNAFKRLIGQSPRNYRYEIRSACSPNVIQRGNRKN